MLEERSVWLWVSLPLAMSMPLILLPLLLVSGVRYQFLATSVGVLVLSLLHAVSANVMAADRLMPVSARVTGREG